MGDYVSRRDHLRKSVNSLDRRVSVHMKKPNEAKELIDGLIKTDPVIRERVNTIRDLINKATLIESRLYRKNMKSPVRCHAEVHIGASVFFGSTGPELDPKTKRNSVSRNQASAFHILDPKLLSSIQNALIKSAGSCSWDLLDEIAKMLFEPIALLLKKEKKRLEADSSLMGEVNQAAMARSSSTGMSSNQAMADKCKRQLTKMIRHGWTVEQLTELANQANVELILKS